MNKAANQAVCVSLNESQDHLKTEMALLFHTRAGKLQLTTVHSASQHKDRVELNPGKPLSPDQEAHVISLLLSSGQDKNDAIEFIPEGVLIDNARFTMWFIPESRRLMHFHTDQGRSSRVVYWPNQMVLAMDNRLYLAAVKDNKRPTPNSPLYFSPCGNVWNNTELCQGNAKSPGRHGIDAIEDWQALIFDSAFSHANNRRCIATGKKFIDPLEYWQSAKAESKFAAKDLVPIGITLNQWLTLISDEERY